MLEIQGLTLLVLALAYWLRPDWFERGQQTVCPHGQQLTDEHREFALDHGWVLRFGHVCGDCHKAEVDEMWATSALYFPETQVCDGCGRVDCKGECEGPLYCDCCDSPSHDTYECLYHGMSEDSGDPASHAFIGCGICGDIDHVNRECPERVQDNDPDPPPDKGVRCTSCGAYFADCDCNPEPPPRRAQTVDIPWSEEEWPDD